MTMDQCNGGLTDRQFKKYRDIVYNQCGIRLSDDKRELLNARLSRCLRNRSMHAGQYLALIQRDAEEMEAFVDAISTNHTFFFREATVFNAISEKCRNIWCAAASSGEEPYSLASYCHHNGIHATILATDISRSCLSKAHKGIYPIEGSKHIPQPILKQCFQKGTNQWAGFMRVKPKIKKNVRFEFFNLLKDKVPDTTFDIIFCRNVMIYFDRPTRQKVIHKLCNTLNIGGFFIIGGAESLNGLTHSLTYREPSIYQKS